MARDGHPSRFAACLGPAVLLGILSTVHNVNAQLSTSSATRPSSRPSRPGEAQSCFCPCAVLGLVVIAISACSALFIVILIFFLVRQRKRIKQLLREQETSCSAKSSVASSMVEDSRSVKEVERPYSGDTEKISINFPPRSVKSPASSSAELSLPPATPRVPSPLPPLSRKNSSPLPLPVPPTPPAKSPAMSVRSGRSVTFTDERHEETIGPGHFDEVMEEYHEEDEYETVEEFHSPVSIGHGP